MARRRTVRKMPLEWKTDTITTSDATITAGEFDLDLMPDEIAEIRGIKSIINTLGVVRAVNDLAEFRKMLSMDPDADDDPLVEANLEDLEVFYVHALQMMSEWAEATETGGLGLVTSHEDQMWFPPDAPILLGTNFAQVVRGPADVAADWITTVYFKRRGATASELNQILLKRR